MNLTAHLLYRLTANRPCRLIPINGRPYLERYYIGGLLGWKCYLHRFVRDDDERALHNHPWDHAISLVIKGGYTATEAESSTGAQISSCKEALVWLTKRRVRWLNYITRSDFHQITSVKPETWTLFCHSPRKYRWGFLERTQREIPLYRYYDTPYPTDPKWWETAPAGAHSGREPLGG